MKHIRKPRAKKSAISWEKTEREITLPDGRKIPVKTHNLVIDPQATAEEVRLAIAEELEQYHKKREDDER